MSESQKFPSDLWLICQCFVSVCSIAAVRASSDGLEKLDRLIAKSPTSENYFRRASLRSQCGKHLEAIDDLQQALLAKPGEYRLLLAKAFELNRVGRFTESDKVCEEVNRNRPESLRTEWSQVVLQSCNRKKIRLAK
jgi:hypothetical protein